MEKILTKTAAAVMIVVGCIWLVLGLVCYVLLEESYGIIGAVFALIGAVFLIMALMFLKMTKGYEERLNESRFHGTKLQAKIVEIKCISSVEINGRHPYAVVCEAQSRTFESEYFYHDVHRFDGREMIDVYLDESTGEYFVDLDNLNE